MTSLALVLTLCVFAQSVKGYSTRSEEDRKSEEDRSEEDFFKRGEEEKRHEEENRHEEDKRHNEDRSEEDLGNLARLFRQLRGTLSARSRGSCAGNKCARGSKCRSGETPLLKSEGIRYTCSCPRGKGGYYCKIDNPCGSCPPQTHLCMATNMAKDGKFCYDTKYNLLNSISRRWEDDSHFMKRGYIGYESED